MNSCSNYPENLKVSCTTIHMMRSLYATDASAYREMPLAVAVPKSIADIKN